MVHFECINNNKRKLCPGCLTDYELEKEGYYINTFHLKHLGKGGDKRANIDPPGVQRRKLSFVSCLSLHLMSYQLVHPLKL